MQTFIADIIPKIQKYSKRLDDLTLLVDHHWVSIGNMNEGKSVYIFRKKNSELLIAKDGLIVENGTWEFLNSQSLLLKTQSLSFILKHAFVDDIIMALKLDSTDKYAFFVNESKFGQDFNDIKDIVSFLENKYLRKNPDPKIPGKGPLPKGTSATYKTKQGLLTLQREYFNMEEYVITATLNGQTAPNGKYRLGFMWYVVVLNGIVV